MLNWQSKSFLDYGAKQFITHVNPERPLQVVVAATCCLNAMLMQLDTYCSLTVVVLLLVSEDEKALGTCISCLTKLVGRLPSEELMAKLPSFLLVLFDAFDILNAEMVVFCLVEIYIVLGKPFAPYLGSLSSTQLRLVTIYANCICQVVVPLLVSEDEKALGTGINCLTKLVGRLPSEELMEKLPSFLLVLFDAFDNQNTEV
ncbi:unnamed protein product [Sphagnum jensenii]|uniref:Uncharacterized protein n=1 Tax=Sphagnum jensenii TaxID=128206 RepID=A0ABP1B9A9_9BRYO